MAKATTMAVVNQKGGTGKTTTCENLGIHEVMIHQGLGLSQQARCPLPGEHGFRRTWPRKHCLQVSGVYKMSGRKTS